MPRAKRAATTTAAKADATPNEARAPKRARQVTRSKASPEDQALQQYGITTDQHDRLSASVADKVIDKLLAMGVIPSPSQPTPTPSTQGPEPGPQQADPVTAQPPGSSAASPTPQHATPVEQQVADQVIQGLAYGESDPLPHPSNITSTPLAYHVGDRLREKIKADIYVDLKLLLPGNAEAPYTLRVDRGQGEPALHLASTNSKPLQSIEQWLTAFNAFQFIYIQAHPDRAQDLLKYCETVRTINHRFGFPAARFYDENFRLLKQQDPQLSYAVTHPELWMNAATIQPPQPFRTRPSSTHQTPRPMQRGFCFAYNSPSTFCNQRPCKFRHACSQCQGPHPKFRCSNNQPAAPTNKPAGKATSATTPTPPNTSRPN